MPQISITKEAHAAIRSRSMGRFRDTSRPAGPNMVYVNLSDRSLNELRKRQLDGETLSETIIRLTATQQ